MPGGSSSLVIMIMAHAKTVPLDGPGCSSVGCELDAGNGFAIETRLDAKSVGDQVPRYRHRVQKVRLHVDGMTEERCSGG